MRFQSLFTLALLGGLTGAVALSGESRADDAEGQLGGLTCNRISGTGVNLLIFSSAQVRCIFKGSTGAQQWYDGKTGVALGVDLKWNVEETIFFGVLSSTVKFVPEGDFLSGRYGGAKADAALGVGVGAAVLLGGSNDTMALKPAVETSKGVGVPKACAGATAPSVRIEPNAAMAMLVFRKFFTPVLLDSDYA